MFRLVTGRAGSGKSEYCLCRAEQLAKEGRYSVIVVPEQSSFGLERTLALRLGPTLARFASVKSFRSLCAGIFAECGGGARKRLSDAVRCSLVRRAVVSMQSNIKCFKRHTRDMSFFALVSSVIDELKNAGAGPAELEAAADDAASALSREKLREIAMIYQGYEQLLGKSFFDPAGEISAAAGMVAASQQFAGKTVLFDGFTGFTEPQLKLISGIMSAADETCVTLCCYGIYSNELDAFTTVRRNGRKLTAAAKENGIDISNTVLPDGGHRFKTNGTLALENFLAGEEASKSDGVFSVVGDDRYDEIRAVADEIAFLVREKGYRYSDIVVTARDTETYRAAVTQTFSRFDIPFFCDSNRSMLYSPVTVFILSALDMASGITTDKIFSMLKTSLTSLDDEIVSELENYTYIWGIDRAGWYSPFTESPNGFGAELTNEAEQALAGLEQARAEISGWLYPITAAKNASGGELIKAVYETMTRAGAQKALASADEDIRREASAALEMLDQLYDIFLQEKCTPAEIRETARLMAAATSVGDVPPTLDQVVVGCADRMRTNNPRAVFVIGLNDGVFPKNAFDTPLLSGAEREILSRREFELSRNFENSAAMEQLYLYRALTCATERVYLCRARRDQHGSALAPGTKPEAFIEKCSVPNAQSSLDAARYIVNRETAVYAYADALEKSGAFAASIESSVYGQQVAAVTEASCQPQYLLGDSGIIEDILGQKISLSATKIDTFSECHFRYFLRYMMGIKPIKKAEISPLEAGNFVHGVMENTMRELGAEIVSAPDEKLSALVETVAADYVSRALGSGAAENPRIKYLVERLKAQSLLLLKQIRAEQQQGMFRPQDYELEIAEKGDIPPIKLVTENGHTVEVSGKVDRVDVYKKDGVSYIRVVDYKTGKKAFRLSDVYHGLSVQMLLYLFTIAQNGKAMYGDMVPAAVMYLPSDPTLPADSENVEQDAKKAYRMDGIVIDDAEVIQAMERDVQGIYIPVKATSGGYKKDKVASLERMGNIKRHIENTVVDIARTLYDGDVDACPIVKPGYTACDYCDYAAVCRHDRSDSERVLENLDDKELFND